jgi:DNA helicase-2/ATP-dependent DNA helicase PcrA
MALNPEQELAASHINGPCLVTACPGSGKTKTIEERTARLIDHGIPPHAVLSITFTNKAADEMRERIARRIGDAAKRMEIRTFHGLCARLLRKNGHVLGYGPNITILDDGDQVDLLAQVVRSLGHEYTKPAVKTVLWQINDERENLENDDQAYARYKSQDEAWFEISREYQKRLREQNSTDFSGLLSETVRLLGDDSVLSRIHNWVKYLQVDEVQDTNMAQFKIMDMLGRHTRNIFCVGDLDQSIYGWRGARQENVRDFLKTYPDAKIIKLGKNYRSTPQIVAVADKLIRYNSDRIAADFTTDNPSGSPVLVKAFDTDRQEADFIANSCKQLITAGSYKPKEIAVFFRLNSMSRAIEMAMMAKKVPHKVLGTHSFYDRMEVKDVLCMLRFLVNPKDGIAFHRIANKPKRHLGDVTVGKIENLAKLNGTDLIQTLKDFQTTSDNVKDGISQIILAFDWDYSNRTIPEVIDILLKKLRYDEHLKLDDEKYDERKRNVSELINAAAQYNAEHGSNIAQYLESLTLMSQADTDDEEQQVKLMSLHASKGLEFPVVFMVGCEQDILPHKKAVQEREGGLEEERRLCYVGITRGKKIVSMSYCKRRQDGFAARSGSVKYKQVEPSQFLEEAGLIPPRPKKDDRSNRPAVAYSYGEIKDYD